MSRLWDTAEFWARIEADEMLREMNDAAPGALADSLERNAANEDRDPGSLRIHVFRSGYASPTFSAAQTS